MKVVIRLSAKEELKALPVLMRHSPDLYHLRGGGEGPPGSGGCLHPGQPGIRHSAARTGLVLSVDNSKDAVGRC
jgi:hypothetical protein